MLILLDSCVWGGARAQLAAADHDVIWAGDWPEDPGDEEILARAHTEGRSSSPWIRTSANWLLFAARLTAVSCD